MPSRCIFFFKTRKACSTLLSRTKTCIDVLRFSVLWTGLLRSFLGNSFSGRAWWLLLTIFGGLAVPRHAQRPQPLGPCSHGKFFLLVFAHRQVGIPCALRLHGGEGGLLFGTFGLAAHCDRLMRLYKTPRLANQTRGQTMSLASTSVVK